MINHPYGRLFVLSIASVLAAATLVGCGTPKVWYQPGKTQAETRQDLARCKLDAQMATRGGQLFIPGEGAGGALLFQSMQQDGQRKELVRDAMEAKGYQFIPASQATNYPVRVGSISKFGGRYMGSGEAVENGHSTPYKIILDINDIGAITFVCTDLFGTQNILVNGKGSVDGEGHVVIQNEFGATGEGKIEGTALKAGGQTTDGSTKSYFTALKQE